MAEINMEGEDSYKKEAKEEKKEEISENEKRVRAITQIYYSNPKVQEALLKFASEREVVPRYFDGFGKRPDSLQYQSDIMGLVSRGATSFHASEEIWNDVLKINSDMTRGELNALRKGWDLLIDIDSPYFDLSKIAAKLIAKALEFYGIKNYGIKFSGSKGFHIIVPASAFPEEHEGLATREMFPEWPRAITEFLFKKIEPSFMKEAGKVMSFSGVEKKESVYIECINCERRAKRGMLARFRCEDCGLTVERRDVKLTKRKLKCLNDKCSGFFKVEEEAEYSYCEYCKDPDNNKLPLSSDKHPDQFRDVRGENVSEHAKLDLVLVAPRHLFRMPYSLHEKTSLASVVLTKEELESFIPRDANPLNVKIKKFLPECERGEAKSLLVSALEWKKIYSGEEEKIQQKKYEGYEKIDLKNVKIDESMFPQAIKKLLLGLEDGKKRGLFILLTFLKSLGFSAEYINNKVRDWNKLNKPPLKEGYVKSQIDWHLKQKKQILPPNYENESFYRDLKLIDKKQDVKNPLVEVMRKVRKGQYI